MMQRYYLLSVPTLFNIDPKKYSDFGCDDIEKIISRTPIADFRTSQLFVYNKIIIWVRFLFFLV
jgi:hypothetical protein